MQALFAFRFRGCSTLAGVVRLLISHVPAAAWLLYGASGPSGIRLWRGKTGIYRQPLSVGRVICRGPPVGPSVGRRENGFADRRASSFLVCGFTGRIREKQFNGKSPIPNQNQKAQNQTQVPRVASYRSHLVRACEQVAIGPSIIRYITDNSIDG